MYGKDSEDGVIPPLYLGYPWLLRGYNNNSYSNNPLDENTFNFSMLSGTKIAVANAEIRFPFTGPERLALIKSKYLLTDINLFFDSGLAWSRGSKIGLSPDSESFTDGSRRSPVLSTGASVRINLFGYLVIEPYYAFPISNDGFKNGVFGLNFVPGW
jgi:outer membrane protein assembly factor BamA